MSIKFLLIIHKLSYGGAEKNMAFLANNLLIAGHDVNLITYENDQIMQKVLFGIHHFKIHHVISSAYGIRRLLQISSMRKAIKTIKPDIIISFLTYPNMISIIASLGLQIPVIISERGDPYSTKGWFYSFKDLIYRLADGYVFQSEEAMKFYNSKIQNKATVIPNPVTIKILTRDVKTPRDNIIVNVARLELKQKRQDLLIKAFSMIASKYPTTKLIMFGDGEDEQTINKIILQYRLENQVILAGVSMNIFESIKNARLFVLSSDYEGIPNALIEALSFGLPCISTDYSPGGAKNLINNNKNGILVKIDSAEELSAAMEYILCNPMIAECMGQNALKIIDNLDPEIIMEKWQEYINFIIQKNPKTVTKC
ncbi:MAG: glycosyltransferase [Chloroflexi bacterium]|nr:glycosyltransferase [Chloroflexota bacterium]